MPGKDGGRLRRRSGFALWSAAFVVLEVAFRLLFESRWLDGRPVAQAAVVVVAGIVAVAWLFKAIPEFRRRRRDRLDARVTGRWPTGRPHLVAMDARCDGSRVPATLVFESGGLRVDPAPDPVPDVIPFAGVATVRVRSTWIEIDTSSWTFRVVPNSYEDRQRLLWEFALHANAAVERGIDEAAGAERSRAAALKPAPAASATDAANLDGLDRGVTSLGSALAGPAQRRNPAPPRNSGLGNGLFVVPDGDAK